MGLRNARPLTFTAKGLSDAPDASVAFPGAMASLSNLVQKPGSKDWVCRPASVQLTNFAGFNTPAGVTAIYTLGTRVYGMISSADFAGKDVPFCWDTATSAFVAITGQLAALLPATQSLAGDWQPPKMEMVANRIMVTHPGFPGGAGAYFGWIDVSGFTSNTITGTTHTSTLIDTLSANPITAGWMPGMKIAGAGIPANTTIVSMTAASVTLSQATTASAAGVALTVTGGTAAAPLWGAGNTNTNPLTAVPASVTQMSGRAWYAVGNTLVYSDSLNPTQVTNATQALTLGDNVAITALGGVPLNSQLGGIVQSIMAFKGDSAIFQVTGDSATNNLSLNELKNRVGTIAPNSLAATPVGLAFLAADGLRFVDQTGRVTPPIGVNGQGVCVPFINAILPTRIAAAYNENVLRISVTNGAKPNSPREEYWFDINQNIWTGPHTFPADFISPIDTSARYVLAATGINGKLWSSPTQPVFNSTYVENGVTLSFTWQPALLPDNQEMAENCVTETTLTVALPLNYTLNIQAINDRGAILDSLALTGAGSAASTWGSFNWDVMNWGGGIVNFRQYQLPWKVPLVFKQGTILITGNADANFIIGNLYLKYQVLGYLLQTG